tara:strand:- start:31 stop:366 length:336 start_codon:yes stop_codon:yes gene_type:complete
LIKKIELYIKKGGNMKKVDIITTADSADHYCFLCGQKNVGTNGVEKPCEHLIYVGTSEGVEYDKLKLHNVDNEDKSPHEIIETLDDNYVGFYVSAPAPSALEAYIVYKLTV